jgi:hypothetical protein
VFWLGDIPGSHGDEYEDVCLLDVAPCNLVETDRSIERFRGAYCLHHQVIALMMEAVSTSEMSVSFYQTTRRNIPADSRLQIGQSTIYVLA